MKKVLFTIDSLGNGGAERGAAALLKNLDYTKYEADLLYFCRSNEHYKDSIPPEVRIIVPDIRTELALSSKSFVIKNIFKIRYWNIIFRRLWYGFIKITDKKSRYKLRNREWRSVRKFVPELAQHYDCAVAVDQPIYYIFDKVSSDKYIAFQRTDYKKSGCSPEWDFPYFERAGNICVLSEEMKVNFTEVFPSFSSKIVVLPNIYDVKEMLLKSEMQVSFDDDYSGPRIISAGTLRSVKRYDTAVLAARKLADAGYNFKWYVLGEGGDRKKIQKQIKKLLLDDIFILVGSKQNPYPYLKRSDIFVQCSEREGFSTSLFEAKCLRMPIVITDAPGLRSQIENRINGLTVPVGDYAAAADAIAELLESEDMRKIFSGSLKIFADSLVNDTAEKLQIFDKLIEI